MRIVQHYKMDRLFEYSDDWHEVSHEIAIGQRSGTVDSWYYPEDELLIIQPIILLQNPSMPKRDWRRNRRGSPISLHLGAADAVAEVVPVKVTADDA
jgi:hypothetical protein